MRAQLLILTLLTLSFGLKANDPDPKSNKNNDKSGTSEKEVVSVSSEISEESITSSQLEKSIPKNDNQVQVDVDSSHYSVNKFNYLFYFIYKMKYMGSVDELDATIQPAPGLQE